MRKTQPSYRTLTRSIELKSLLRTAGYWKVNFRWRGSKDSNLNNDQNNMQLNIYQPVYWFCRLYYINHKNCSVPYSCHFVRKCLVAIKRKRRKKRKKEAADIIKKYIYSRTKLVKLKVPVNIQDNSSRIAAVVWNYTVREENKVQMVAFT